MSDSMIAESTERLFAGEVTRAVLDRFEAGQFPHALWQQVTDQGLTLALAGEAAGGIGATWADVYPILRGVGHWQVPLPLAETLIAAQLLSLAGLEVPDGPIALIEEDTVGQFSISHTSVNPSAAGLQLSGTAQRVAWASACRWALISLLPTAVQATGRIALLDLQHSASVQITAHHNPANEPCDTVLLRNAPAVGHAANPFPALRRPLRTLGAIASSAMMVGAMEWLLAQSVQYASDRVQFGKPIGKNQAIQQQLALLAGEVAAARVAAIVACADAPGGGPTPGVSDCAATVFSAAVAKIRCGEAATRSAAIAHQVHGAIGFTFDHRLNFATRRLWAWREAYGADGWWAGKLGEAAIQSRSAGFWPSMTSRRFSGLDLQPNT